MPPKIQNASGFVLAGGQSSRMGTDKALAYFAGEPLIQNAVNIVSEAGLEPGIAGARSDLSEYAPVVADTYAEVGPLGGIHAALSASPSEWNIFLPVDMPLVPAALLSCLMLRAIQTGAPVTATRLNGRLEPYPVLLHRGVLPFLTVRLENRETAGHLAWRTIPLELNATLDAPAIETLLQTGQLTHLLQLPPVYWFQSANTPEDLAALNRRHSCRQQLWPIR